MTGSSIVNTIPNTFYEFAFNADPNQGALPPYWQDLSPRVQFAWDAHPGGRHYELDVNETGTWNHRLVNNDGALDPSNSSSPFAPNVKLFRQCRIRVQVAPTQNLAPRVIATGSASMDPTSDSVANWWYATGAGTIAQANYLTAAPSGQTSALAWTTPSGTTSSNAVLWDGVNTANPTGPVGDDFQVVAGQQYTVSRYLSRVSSADATVQVTLTINWFTSAGVALTPSAGSAVTVPVVTSWARGTVTATAPAGAVWGRPSMAITTPASTTATNTIYVTGCQDEQAGAATSWADPGVTQFIFTGLEERLPQTWTEQQGTYGTSEPVAMDPMGALAVYTLKDPFINEVLAYGPNFFYPLNDPKGTSQCVDAASKRPPAPVTNSPYGTGSLTFGNSITSTSPTLAFQGTGGPIATCNNPNTGANSAQTFVALDAATLTPGPPGIGQPWTRMIAFRTSAIPPNQAEIWFSGTVPYVRTSNQSFIEVQVQPTSGNFNVTIVPPSGVLPAIKTWAGNICDGNWHFATFGLSANGLSATFSLDGVIATTSPGADAHPTQCSSDVLGAYVTYGDGTFSNGFVGDIAFAGEFPALLTSAQIANLYNSFRTASAGDTSGGRVKRVLTWIGWTGPTAIDTGQTASMGPATDLTLATALDALTNVALTENGDVYAATNGAITFKARNARYNKRVPVYTFGEGAPVGVAGEWPCEIAAIEYDPSHLANIVQVTQYLGPLFTAQDTTSQQRYYPRTYQRTVNVSNPAEAQDAANYLLSQLKDPHLRPDTIRLHPSAVPGLFAVCVALAKGTRIRLIKRPTGAPAVTVDAFVEKLDWTWNPDTGDVYVDVQASPADLVNYWQLGALHTILNTQATSGTNTATINALPDSAVNPLAASLPSTYSLTFEPGTARQETLTLAPGGIPATNPGYTTAVLTFTSNFAFTHPAGSVVCEPLPTGYTDPTTWDASSVLGAASTTVNSGGNAGGNTITINALPDSKSNTAASDWNVGDLLWIGAGTRNWEGYNLLTPNQATAGEGVLPLAAGTDGNTAGLSSAYAGTVPVTASGTAWQGANVWQVSVGASAAAGNRLIRVVKAAAAPNQPFSWSIYVRSATTGANPTVHGEIQWLDSTGTVISTITASGTTLTGGPSAAWTRITLSGTSPAGTVWACPSVRLDATTPTSAWAFQGDGLQWEPNNTPSVFCVTPQVKAVAATVPGYTTVQLTLGTNLINSHNPGELVCDPLPPGLTAPTQIAATTRLAY